MGCHTDLRSSWDGIPISSGHPAWRFMRYIRPPDERTKLEPLYPLRPQRDDQVGDPPRERPRTSGRSPDQLAHPRRLLEVDLMVPKEEEAPASLDGPRSVSGISDIGFKSISQAGRWLDTAQFFVHTTSTEDNGRRAHCQLLPRVPAARRTSVTRSLPPVTSTSATRCRIRRGLQGSGPRRHCHQLRNGGLRLADNDLVVSVTPDEAVPLSVTLSGAQSGRGVARPILGGGTWETTESRDTV